MKAAFVPRHLAELALVALAYVVAAKGGLTQMFVCIGAVVGLVVGAVTSERAGAREALLAARDDLERQVHERTAALERTQARLVEAQDLARLGSWEWEVATDTVTWSDPLYQIYGVDPHEQPATFEGYLTRVHPGDRERVLATIRTALAERRSFQFDERIVRPDGEVRVLASRGQVFAGADGRPERVVGICQDVTESRGAERALRDSEERVRLEHAVSRALLESRTLGEARPAVLEAVGMGLGWTTGGWWAPDDGTGDLRCQEFWHDPALVAPAFESASRQLRCARGRGLPGRVWATGDVHVIPTLAEDPDFPRLQAAVEAGLTAAIAVPLVIRGEVAAVIEFFATEGPHLGAEVAEMMARLGERIAQDVERKDAEDHLREAEERFRRAFEDAGTGMALVGFGGEDEGRFLEVNDALCAFTRYSREELLTMTNAALLHPDDAPDMLARIRQLDNRDLDSLQCEMRLLDADGGVLWTVFSTSVVRDGDGRALYRIAQVQDITERKRFEDQLQHLADHDPVTALFNRRRLEEELARELAAAARYGTGGAVLALDLDNFKYVNDTLGHSAGDELIARVAEILRTRLRRTDTVARLGGDEFAVVLPHVDERRARRVAEDLLAAIRGEAVITTAKGSRRATASVGIALFPDAPAELTGEALLVEADIAMYDAKEAGGDRACVYDAGSSRQRSLEASVTWGEQIREALAEDRFTLYAQPIVPLQGAGSVRHELLVRMVGRDGDIIPPGAFLPVAERLDLVQEIDRWVVRRAIELLAERRRTGDDVSFEVNLSAKSLGDPDLQAQIAEQLAATGVDPSRVVFEVTETAAIVNVERAKQFALHLRELGCGFALDDFGAGFASFYYLKHLPFDYLKIDGEFVESLIHSPTNQLVVEAVVSIARGLGKRTIAEYVGDEETLQLLRRYGVDYAQGFHVGRPVPVEQIEPAPAPAVAVARREAAA